MTKTPRIAKAKGRSAIEWVGAVTDAKIPAHVKLRVLRRFGNKCALTGILIADGQPFDCDHVVRLDDGGRHAESNLQPVLRLPHEVKSAAERKIAAKADRIAKKGHGLTEVAAKKIDSAGFMSSAKKPAIEKRPAAEIGMTQIERMFGSRR